MFAEVDMKRDKNPQRKHISGSDTDELQLCKLAFNHVGALSPPATWTAHRTNQTLRVDTIKVAANPSDSANRLSWAGQP
jgi:hypothetical protein